MENNDLSLTVPCAICGAGKGRRCELYAGGIRAESHLHRRQRADQKLARASKLRNKLRAAPIVEALIRPAIQLLID
jgi:hypothetical protein